AGHPRHPGRRVPRRDARARPVPASGGAQRGRAHQPLGRHGQLHRALGADGRARRGGRSAERRDVLMEDIAIVAFAQTPSYRRYTDSEPSLLMGLVNRVLDETGLERREIDFTIAGSCDYLSGMPFAFTSNADPFVSWRPS